MSDERCDCCDLPLSSCGKAAEGRERAAERRERARLAALPGATLAQYPGTCGECGERFDKGDPIRSRSAYDRHRDPLSRDAGSPWRGLLCCGPS